MRHALLRCARSAGLAVPSACLALALGQAVSASAAAAGHASTPAAPATSPPPVEARLLFLGDIMLGRYVGAAMAAHGPDAPFDRARTWLSAADVTIANLEGPLVPPGAFAIPPPSPGLLNLTGSTASAGALARAGFDVLSVANNHSLDAGEAGLAHTRRSLTGVGIASVGLLRDGAAAGGQGAVVREVRGIRVAFLAYTLVLNSATTTVDRAAAVVSYVRPGVDADVAGVAREVAAARRSADAVAVVVHWGTEYARRPDSTQRRFAQVLADAGANVIVGAHPHVVQGVEVLQSGVDPSANTPAGPSSNGSDHRAALVAYSLGNALFDQGGDAATREGAALAVDIGRNGVTGARLIPLAIAAGPAGFTMRRLDDVEGRGVIDRAAASTAPALLWRTLARSDDPAPVTAVAVPPPVVATDFDLGLGRPTRITLRSGRLAVSAQAADGTWRVVWRTAPGWQVDGYAVGDVARDEGDAVIAADEGMTNGRNELIYWLRKPQLTWSRPSGGGMRVLPDGGAVRPHLFVEGWRHGAMRPVWHGSARPGPVLAAAVAPIGPNGRALLATVEGDDRRSGGADKGTLRLWAWTGGFGFRLVRALAGEYVDVWAVGEEMLFR